jgi:hypothetical protein
MSKQTDWLPTTRAGQLAMAGEWITVCTAKQTSWGISQSDLTNLTSVRDLAKLALEAATNESTRTPVATARCKTMFGQLTKFMRYFKQHYFLSPPLAETDLISLGLKPHDKHPTPSGVPTAQVAVETYLKGQHEIGVRLSYASGDPDDPANKSFRIWHRMAGPGETPPASPEHLDKSVSTKRMNDVLELAYEDSGKQIFIAVQVENGKKKGPWGPMVSAHIP